MTVVSIAATNRPVRSAVGVVAVPWRWTLCDLGPLVSGKTTVLRRERLGTGQSFGSFFIKFILLISASGVGTVGNIPHYVHMLLYIVIMYYLNLYIHIHQNIKIWIHTYIYM